jgi:hypothetical protein
MKNALLLIALLFTLNNAFSQTAGDATTATTMLPSATALKLIQYATETTLSPFITTSASAQARGVAGREQLKDDLVALEEDMKDGDVAMIGEIRQPALKELFGEIAADEKQMAEINSLVKSGSKLHKIATAVTVDLMLQ